MGLDLLTDGGFVFADGLGDGSFGGAIGDAFEDDAAFFQSQVEIRIRIIHGVTSDQGRHLPIRKE